MSTANPPRAGKYEKEYGGTEAGRLVGFNSSDSDDGEAPQPLSPQYINNDNSNKKRGNGVDHSSIAPIQHEKPAAAQSSAEQGKALKIITYGAVNAMMAIPILYGYAAIIFRYYLQSHVGYVR